MFNRLVKLFLSMMLFGQVMAADDRAVYTVNPGDVLEISVWNEDKLQRELRVLPDGSISFPLAGTLNIAGKTINIVQKELTEKLTEYIAEPVVNITVNSVEGNSVYVIGQVKNPGRFIMYQPMDVMQILSLAGGLTTFAKSNDIVILRRSGQASKAIEFAYDDLEEGEDLDKNQLLKSGDVIVVP